jgi:hypothetical protein
MHSCVFIDGQRGGSGGGHPLNVRTYCILRYFVLSLNTPLFFRIVLRLLMPTSWNASSRSLLLSVLIVCFFKSITVTLLHRIFYNIIYLFIRYSDRLRTE